MDWSVMRAKVQLGPLPLPMAAARPHNSQSIEGTPQARTWSVLPAAGIGVLLAIEIVTLLVTYSFGFDCTDFVSITLCHILSLAEIRAVTFISALLLLMLSHPSLRPLLYVHEHDNGWWTRRQSLLLQLIGFAVVMLPWGFAVGASI